MTESVEQNFVDALITSFAFTAVTIAASNIIQHFQCFKEGTLVSCIGIEGNRLH